jgi:hypothetical protein
MRKKPRKIASRRRKKKREHYTDDETPGPDSLEKLPPINRRDVPLDINPGIAHCPKTTNKSSSRSSM